MCQIDYKTKVCTMCGIEKPESSEFFQFRYERGHFFAHCLECKQRKAREYIARPEINKRRKRQAIEQIEERKKYLHEYYLENKEVIKNRAVENRRKKRKQDPTLRLRDSVSSGIRMSLKNNKNGMSWEELVGYTQDDLRKHLESQFADGMTWDNYGAKGWTIDHIIPVSLFNITGPKSKGFKKCWELQNLRPMWYSDNFSKNDRLFY